MNCDRVAELKNNTGFFLTKYFICNYNLFDKFNISLYYKNYLTRLLLIRIMSGRVLNNIMR